MNTQQLNRLGIEALEAQGKFTQAFTEFDQALTLMPEAHEYHHKRGWLLYRG